MKRRILSLLCAVAILMGMVTVPAFATVAEGNLQDKVNDYTSGVIALSENAENLTVEANTYIDLNGHTIAGVTVADGATLFVSDSQTDDYTVADGICGAVTGIAGSVQAAEGYLAIEEEDAVSFHRVDLAIKSMSLRPGNAGVYYRSHFAADEVVAAKVESYGVALSVAAEPTAENLETLCGYSVLYDFSAGEKSGTLLTGIMDEANDAETNAAYAAMDIYGRAYIKTEDGYTFGTVAVRDLQEQVEAIDAIFESLTETQRAGFLAMYETYKAAMSDWNIPNLRGNQLGDTVITVPVQTENGVVTEEITVEKDGVSITIPFGALVEAAQLTLNVTKKVTSDSGIKAAADQQLLPFDVHVDGVSPENTVPLTVALGKVMPENLNMGNYSIYHVEADGTKEMQLVANEDAFTAHNQYKYTLDGELTLHMATFSEVAAVADNEAKWEGNRDYSWYDAEKTELEIRNADQLAGFGAIVGGMDGKTADTFAGKTVKLLADINIGDLDSENGIVFYPIGYYNSDGTYEKTNTAITSGFYTFEGTFDGNGNTISNFYQNTWEMKGDNEYYAASEQYYRDGMGLFGKVYGGAIKNLTVENFSSDGEYTTTGVIAAYADSGNGKSAVFENIAIFNCNPRVYNIGNGGIVGCAGWYSRSDETAKGNPVTFKNITVDQSNKISALWGTYDVSCGGILGQYYPDSSCGLLFKDCHVAAIIDVNNDVCANYQYYWYRYSGMLMGTVRANKKDNDGYTVADTTGIVAEGCTYTYGEWNEYWYCELVKNSSASYTHDYQFGRLTNIGKLSDIQDAQGNWIKEGSFALVSPDRKSVDCYHIFKNSEGNLYRHFHNVPDESNPDVFEDFDLNGDGELNDLKEDRQRYYLPFGQVLNGLGYGVKPTYEFEGFKLVEDGTVVSVPKFEEKENAILTYKPGQKIILSDIVKLAIDKSKLSESSIYVAASPLDENGIVSIDYTRYEEAWEDNYFIISNDAKGTIKLVITDYFYCEPTVIYLNEEQAAPKFIAKTVVAQNAYTRITLGDLFGTVEGANVGNVTATVTDPNGNETTVTGTSSDWAAKTIDLTKDGTWTVVIKDDDAYCAVTTVTFTVNKVDVFANKFTGDLLYRVGNASGSTVAWSTIFGYTTDSAPVNVKVTIENVKGDASGTFTNGNIQFNGTGVVNVTISADGANDVSLFLEVVKAKNYASASISSLGSGNTVLLCNTKLNNNGSLALQNASLYGNGFEIDVSAGKITGESITANYLLYLNNGILDNVQVKGAVYTAFNVISSNSYNNPTVLSIGNSKIVNSYISNCASPVRMRSGNLEIINSTLKGGYFANLDIRGGNVVLDNVTTINQVNLNDKAGDGKEIAGLGVVFFYEGPSSDTTLEIKNKLTQHNFMSDATTDNSYANMLTKELFGNEKYASLWYTDANGRKWANTGILSLSEAVDKDNIIVSLQTNKDEYTEMSVSYTIPGEFTPSNGYLYTAKPEAPVESYTYVSSAQYEIVPKVSFDHSVNEQLKQENSETSCTSDPLTDKETITFADGDSFAWKVNILKSSNKDISYTVWMDDTQYTDTIVFDQSGEYTITFKYTDKNNYRKAGDTIEQYTVEYETSMGITVSEFEQTAKNAEITFPLLESYGTTKVVVDGKTYIMPNLTGTNIPKYGDDLTFDASTRKYGSLKSDGKTSVDIYYPIIKTAISGNYMVFPVFGNKNGTLVQITDYTDNGTGAETTYNASTQTLPSSLSVSRGYTVQWSTDKDVVGSGSMSYGSWANGTLAFKYQSSSDTIACKVMSNYLSYYPDINLRSNDRNEQVMVAEYKYVDNKGDTIYYCVGYHIEERNSGYAFGETVPESSGGGCVTPDTLVTLADGSQKEIQYVTNGEQLLVWNFFKGEYEAVPAAVVVNHGYGEWDVIRLTFADGTVVKAVNAHAFFDADLNRFVNLIPENATDYVGHKFVKGDGVDTVAVELVACEVTKEYTGSYSAVSAYHYNFIADGFFSMTNRIDAAVAGLEVGENLKYDEEILTSDIAQYGLYTYEDFAPYLSELEYNVFSAPYVKISVEKGCITWEEVLALIEEFLR